MRKLIAASLLFGILFAGCADDPNYKPPLPDGTFVIHKLSKRKGIVISQSFSDRVVVRFVATESTVAVTGTIVHNQRFEDVTVRPFEVEISDQPTPKAN